MRSLKKRDQYSARIVAKAFLRNPGKLIYVVDGDLHIAPDHLPKHGFGAALPACGGGRIAEIDEAVLVRLCVAVHHCRRLPPRHEGVVGLKCVPVPEEVVFDDSVLKPVGKEDGRRDPECVEIVVRQGRVQHIVAVLDQVRGPDIARLRAGGEGDGVHADAGEEMAGVGDAAPMPGERSIGAEEAQQIELTGRWRLTVALEPSDTSAQG